MSYLPRLAIGTVQPGAELSPIQWALLDVLDRDGLKVQCFQSRACFTGNEAATTVTGLAPRHLDSWLMSREMCSALFARGSAASDLALVAGEFPCPCKSGKDDATTEASGGDLLVGGDLATLCDWLDLPRIMVLDASRLSDCKIPDKPPQTDAFFLDRVESDEAWTRLKTNLEALWGIPVLGALDPLPVLRAAVRELPLGNKPPREWCRALGDSLLRHFNAEQLLELANRRYSAPLPAPLPIGAAPFSGVRIAIAFDDCFHGYFPDTLEQLELQGAVVCDFSPLRDEALPPETDVVYLGCGHPERFAEALGENHCMLTALRNHMCSGRRIYAEGGGLAYLCRQLETPDGGCLPMVGAIPAVARRHSQPQKPYPVEVTLARDSWLGEAGSRLRGYRQSAWVLEPRGPLDRYAAEPQHDLDLVGRHHVLGSRIHLNFAAQPNLLARFTRPWTELPHKVAESGSAL